MICKCKYVIATDGCAEPVILINGKWRDLINLGFKCPKCDNKIEFSNKNIEKYGSMWDVKL